MVGSGSSYCTPPFSVFLPGVLVELGATANVSISIMTMIVDLVALEDFTIRKATFVV